MGIYEQLKGLLKAQYIEMKRNIILSLIEIFCPIILLFLFLILSLLFKTKTEKYESNFKSDKDFIANYSTNLTNYIDSQGQNQIENIIGKASIPYYYFLAQCKYINHIALIGKDFPEKLKNLIYSHFWELDNDINKNDFFQEFSNVEEFEKYMTSKEYGTDEILYPKICFGISKIDKFKFGIHYNTKNIDNENSNEVEDLMAQESPYIPEMKSNKNEKVRNQENLNFFKYYKNSGYLMTMKIIYDYFLQEVTHDSNAEIKFSVIGMKYNQILKYNFHRFLSLLGFFIIISYSIPFSINIYNEIHFREIKKKEYLKSMGVKEIIFFMSLFIKCFIINLFQSIICALLTKLILTQSQYLYLFLIFLLFGLVIFSMIYFFQSFLQESRMGVIISLLIFCIMSFFYLPITSPAVSKSFIYFICIIFPTSNLLLGFNNFYVLEKEFSPLNNRINLDISQITIRLMILFLLINFIIYLFLGYIISQFFCYDYGVNKFTCCSKKNIIDETGNYSKNNISRNYKNNINYKGSNISSEKINKISNPPKNSINNDYNDNFNQLGQNYMDNDYTNQLGHDYIDNVKDKINNEKYAKDLKYKVYDYVQSLSQKKPINILEQKKNEIKKSINIFSQNMKKGNKKNIKNEDEKNEEDLNPHYLNDELEMNIYNQIEVQEIRNKRRMYESTMYNLKPEEDIINKNLKVSNIKCIMDSFMSETVKEMFEKKDSEQEKKFNEVEIKKNEVLINREDSHTGQRLEIKNIKKRYHNDKNLALNDLSFNLYENEIYALLGQNGAGKSTLISILSGLIQANSGSIRYKTDKNDEGIEIMDPKGNVQFRKILGVCPQNNNILYDNLTVKENLEIFCLLKFDKKLHGNDEKNYIEDEIEKLLKNFELREEQNNLSKNLSGGLKRRLCIAIAFCGRSKVIILDEPTGGVDLSNRKKLMYILKNMKNDKKIILLITHFMEEASFLADKIGILKKGKLMCSGTNRELIDNYGNFLTIQINQRYNSNTKNLIKYIKENLILKDGESQIINETGPNMIDTGTTISIDGVNSINKDKMEINIYKERIVIKIPTRLFDFSQSYNLLKNIENEYKINDYRILKDQLEDSFINIIQENNININDKRDYLELSEIEKHVCKFSFCQKFINELKILFFKRGYETLRDKKSFILEILFPILLTLIACFVAYFEFLEENKKTLIELNNFCNDTQSINFDFLNINEFYLDLIYNEENKEIEKIKNFHFNYLKNAFSHILYNLVGNLTSYFNTIYEYNKNNSISNNSANFFIIKADHNYHKYEFSTFVSTKQRHSSIVYSNYILNNIIKHEMKKSNEYKNYIYNVGIVNSPFPLSYKEKNNKKSRKGFLLAFYISIALALIPSNFITIIIREKENKSKHLQLLSGLSITSYWINNYIFELIKYYVVVGLCLILLVIFKFYEKYLALLYVFYGPALVSFTYFISYFIEHEGAGQTIILLINLIFGALGGSAVLILRTHKDMKNLGIFLSYIFRFVPSFCISYGYSELMSKNALFSIDYFKNVNDYEKVKKKYDKSSSILTDSKYISNDIIFLVLEMFIYTGFLIFFENKDYFIWRLGFMKNKNEEIKNNIISQEVKVNEHAPTSERGISNKNEDIFPLEVIKLQKNYKFMKNLFNCCKKREIKNVISNLSFQVKNGECFGLLGANGEGKTTSFKCLCKEIRPDSGYIKINNIDIFDYSIKEKPIIGYCPQFDSIFEFLTVYENLLYYGRLKGIIENDLRNVINILLRKLNLEMYSNKLSGQLSGGNKRKLSVGISLICQPCIILMDEPSTGMDPYTRKLLLQLLHKAYLNNKKENDDIEKQTPRSILLTTHSIEEAESLCDNIGILVSGKFKVNGKISEILKNNSKGIELNLEFIKASPDDLKKKYGRILRETLEDEEKIKQFLYFIKKDEYCKYLKNDNLGKDILKVVNSKGKINKFTILRWVKHLDNLIGLVKKIKKYFDTVHCVKFKLNNFILRIKNIGKDKNDNHLFGIIEQYKDEFCIEEYSYTLVDLETIFLECYKSTDENEENEYNIAL